MSLIAASSEYLYRTLRHKPISCGVINCPLVAATPLLVVHCAVAYMFRPVGEPCQFANRPIFANHAKVDVTFLQYVCNIFAQLRTGGRFATRPFFAKYKDKLINNYADNKLEYKKKKPSAQPTVPPSASGLENHTQ